MYYKSIEDLPDEVKQKIPEEHLELYRDVFNRSYNEYEDPESRGTNLQEWKLLTR